MFVKYDKNIQMIFYVYYHSMMNIVRRRRKKKNFFRRDTKLEIQFYIFRLVKENNRYIVKRYTYFIKEYGRGYKQLPVILTMFVMELFVRICSKIRSMCASLKRFHKWIFTLQTHRMIHVQIIITFNCLMKDFTTMIKWESDRYVNERTKRDGKGNDL